MSTFSTLPQIRLPGSVAARHSSEPRGQRNFSLTSRLRSRGWQFAEQGDLHSVDPLWCPLLPPQVRSSISKTFKSWPESLYWSPRPGVAVETSLGLVFIPGRLIHCCPSFHGLWVALLPSQLAFHAESGWSLEVAALSSGFEGDARIPKKQQDSSLLGFSCPRSLGH